MKTSGSVECCEMGVFGGDIAHVGGDEVHASVDGLDIGEKFADARPGSVCADYEIVCLAVVGAESKSVLCCASGRVLSAVDGGGFVVPFYCVGWYSMREKFGE